MSERASIERILSALFAKGDLDDGRADRWDALREHGLVHPFQSGAERWSDGALILDLASAYAPGVPLAENIVASYLLRAHDSSLEARRLTWADPSTSRLLLDGDHVSGRALLVPHAAVSSHLLCEARVGDGQALVCLEMRGIEALGGENAAGEPRDELLIQRAPARVLGPVVPSPGSLFFVAALARSIQMVSLGRAVLEMSVEHARTRVQFGQPIARFQAVQQQLASLACQVAAAECAVQAASLALDDAAFAALDTQAKHAISAAKLQVGTLAEQAVAIGHAIHAAIGFTREHRLHRYTRRLLSYRGELGPERAHARLLGEHMIARGPDMLWNDLVRGGVWPQERRRKSSMDLKAKLSADLKDAMRAKDTVRLDTIRSVRAAITQREVDTQKELDDAAVADIVRGLRKQRVEAFEQYQAGGRPELAEREAQEKALLEAYLPTAPDAAAIEATVRAVVAELGASSVKDMGRVMQAAKARLAGVDGQALSAVVKGILSGL